ncbi:MAG TPA: 3-deoxy-7-phosphoheptulonate synthase class II [Phycisphaerales bacterium]|nr:3-deoxy-7-phosphoheptulonate synthase class II [Phycisphaerales bacterium]
MPASLHDAPAGHDQPWTPDSWQSRPALHLPEYPDAPQLAAATRELSKLPPLVTSWEIERLRAVLAEAQQGKRFLLQGGDCAETLDDCQPQRITNKLKILLQMSLVLVHALKKPVVRVGRFAGQYSKPRSSPVETREIGGEPVTLPSYFGDLVNRAEFTPQARRADPRLLLKGYQHAALTLNFVRSLVAGGFADVHHPEYWDVSFSKQASLDPALRAEYQRMTANLIDGLKFMEAMGETSINDLTRAEFFTSHEALNLWYESAQTRPVPRRAGFYNLSTHLPWIGDRTRALGGAHVEYARGIRNPVGVKLGPTATANDLVHLATTLNPANEPGKLVFITRMGAHHVQRVLPPLLEAAKIAGINPLWVCDPMHGNTTTTLTGVKTRSFEAIVAELEATYAAHQLAGVPLGGVHLELTGDDVTECTGGAVGITESQLSQNYASACDPRLNYQQALEVAFLLARRMGR